MRDFLGSALGRDIAATVVTFVLSLIWLRAMDLAAARRLVPPRTSRKIIHIGTGPLFVACWLLFSDGTAARWLAALVPLAITAQFVLVGLGVIRDDAAVSAMTRRGDPAEILRGPVYYGVVFVVCTLVFWRTSAVGVTALMILCGGDGLADLVGRRFGRHPLPHSPGKTWEGSAAMFAGGWALAAAMTSLLDSAGVMAQAGVDSSRLPAIAAIALGATLVESLPIPDIDNLTITLASIGLGLLVF